MHGFPYTLPEEAQRGLRHRCRRRSRDGDKFYDSGTLVSKINDLESQTSLLQGHLYHLVSHSRAVDAIGNLVDDKGRSWLIMIQVSMMPYKSHKSKSGDSVSIRDKYKLMAPEGSKAMYIHLSPHKVKPTDLRESGIRSRTSDILYLGAPYPNSNTWDTINFCLKDCCVIEACLVFSAV